MKYKIFYMLCVNSICTKSPVEINNIDINLNASGRFSRGVSRVNYIINNVKFLSNGGSYKYKDNVKVNPIIDTLKINMDKNMEYKTIIKELIKKCGIKEIKILELSFPSDFNERSVEKEIKSFKKIMESVRIQEIKCDEKYTSYFEGIVTNDRETKNRESNNSEDRLLVEEKNEEELVVAAPTDKKEEKFSTEINIQVYETFEITDSTTWFKRFVNFFRKPIVSAPKLDISEKKIISNDENKLVIKFADSASNLSEIEYQEFFTKYQECMAKKNYDYIIIQNLPKSNNKFRNIPLLHSYKDKNITLENPQNREYMTSYIRNEGLSNVKISA